MRAIGVSLSIAIAGLSSILSCPALSAEVHPAANARAGVCILSADTSFKRSLTMALVKDLNSRGISVAVDADSRGGEYRAADYGAVILLSGMRMGRPLPGAVEFIKANDYSPNIIYVFTHTTADRPYGKEGKGILDRARIDAISSPSLASAGAAFAGLEREIVERALRLLSE
jgi:hypothetical protein